mmetsp:Transcript_36446/g.107598  ORF Transcript_36446/g.107598 Transcript_36446/m.107598 type:complete len:227 (-) Transcript_36446:103-783(-)
MVLMTFLQLLMVLHWKYTFIMMQPMATAACRLGSEPAPLAAAVLLKSCCRNMAMVASWFVGPLSFACSWSAASDSCLSVTAMPTTAETTHGSSFSASSKQRPCLSLNSLQAASRWPWLLYMSACRYDTIASAHGCLICPCTEPTGMPAPRCASCMTANAASLSKRSSARSASPSSLFIAFLTAPRNDDRLMMWYLARRLRGQSRGGRSVCHLSAARHAAGLNAKRL